MAFDTVHLKLETDLEQRENGEGRLFAICLRGGVARGLEIIRSGHDQGIYLEMEYFGDFGVPVGEAHRRQYIFFTGFYGTRDGSSPQRARTRDPQRLLESPGWALSLRQRVELDNGACGFLWIFTRVPALV